MGEKMNIKSIALPVGILAAAVLFTSQARANLIVNPGFEADNAVVQVPTGWSANSAYLSEPGFNLVNSNVVNSGLFALQIANFEFQSLPTLSQTFTDVAGATYTASFFATDQVADAGSFLTVTAGAGSLTLTGDIGTSYKQYSFQFTGTGLDTFSISAVNNPNFYYVDDVSVTEVARAVPEPSTWAMMVLGFLGLGFMAYRNKGTLRLA
jgi:hypothetical protein